MIFKRGDKVACNVGHYKSYNFQEEASVLDVEGHLIKLPNDLSDYGWSWYISDNFRMVEPATEIRKKEAQTVGYVKTQYFGMKVRPFEGASQFLPLDQNEQTVLRATKNETIRDIRENIEDGEQWVILQTTGFVTLAPPKIVLAEVSITECR